jgi:hypothetical protein
MVHGAGRLVVAAAAAVVLQLLGRDRYHLVLRDLHHPWVHDWRWHLLLLLLLPVVVESIRRGSLRRRWHVEWSPVHPCSKERCIDPFDTKLANMLNVAM